MATIFAPGVSLYMRVKDKNGPMIFGQPPHEWLRLVHEHPRPWRWATISFIGAILVTLFGLDLLSGLLRGAGDPGFSEVGLLAFAFGAVLWVIFLAARLTVDPWAGKELAATGAIPDAYTALSTWNGAMFVIFSYPRLWRGSGVRRGNPRHESVAALAGMDDHHLQPGGLVILAITRDSLPVMHHLMPLIIGIVLLL